MRWILYALVCSIFLASADFFVKLASNKISSSMGMLIYGATTFTVGLTWVCYLKLTNQTLLITGQGLRYSIAVGLAFSMVTILLYLTFARQRFRWLPDHSCDGHPHRQPVWHSAVT